MTWCKAIFAWGGVLMMAYFVAWASTSSDLNQIDVLSEDLKQKQMLLARLEQLPKREDSIREALNLLDNGLVERTFYRGDLSSIRTEVQRDVRLIANDTGVRIGSMRPMGDRSTSNNTISQSTIQLNYQATNEANLKFLERLEAFEPLLRVQRMSVTVQAPSTKSRAALLSVTMEVSGFIGSEVRGR